MSEFTPKTVLVTGGNRGIGYEIAKEFKAAGHNVCVTYRSGDAPEEFFAVKADVRDAESINEAFKTIEAEFGPVEVLVANAGITRDMLLMRMKEEDFTEVIDTNLTGSFRVVQRAIKGMLKVKRGRIILVSSVVGLYGSPGQVNYSSSKAALVGMARSITRELGGRNITANVVAPGFINTEMTEVLPEETKKNYLDSIPAKRFAEAVEVARVIRWLASDEADYISGAVIPVDGGLGMGH
ncbi:MAG: beta-ketoacyl-ACP reductase [Rothia sp. (in: high G+C Gram-positive bacteria)]|uniref:beta-ketoacyl-ACP reductase n=1 Tax=Rothia sp. (in: high G+C Gram-positive bacteria) TaxID=1885016 RepID=UPI0026E03AF7|nr:beta-ketoacyl-ACP reductase [Rothia sp. (in: high G+C Gram-positive bacteria)]MDO5750875.1 beta-ketoacyl-ACP reductase [Rothia sp. (in: high G+C Gram-positive bacteria)]